MELTKEELEIIWAWGSTQHAESLFQSGTGWSPKDQSLLKKIREELNTLA